MKDHGTALDCVPDVQTSGPLHIALEALDEGKHRVERRAHLVRDCGCQQLIELVLKFDLAVPHKLGQIFNN